MLLRESTRSTRWGLAAYSFGESTGAPHWGHREGPRPLPFLRQCSLRKVVNQNDPHCGCSIHLLWISLTSRPCNCSLIRAIILGERNLASNLYLAQSLYQSSHAQRRASISSWWGKDDRVLHPRRLNSRTRTHITPKHRSTPASSSVADTGNHIVRGEFCHPLCTRNALIYIFSPLLLSNGLGLPTYGL